MDPSRNIAFGFLDNALFFALLWVLLGMGISHSALCPCESVDGTSLGDVYKRQLLYGRAAARIYAQIEKEYQVTQPLKVSAQMPGRIIGRESRFLIAGHAFRLPKSSSAQATRFQQTSLSALSIGGLHFPATIETTLYREVQNIECELSPDLAQAIAEQKIYQSVSSQFESYKILDRSTQIEKSEDSILSLIHI